MHSLLLLGVSDDRAWLIDLMNKDVAKWQAEELAADNEAEVDAATDEGRDPVPVTEWHIENIRFEMERAAGEDLREFSQNDDGEFTTTVYHILD